MKGIVSPRIVAAERARLCSYNSFFGVCCFVTVEAHMHATVEHDVLSSDGDQDTAPADVLPRPEWHDLDGHALVGCVG
jgi:hypothetical protein